MGRTGRFTRRLAVIVVAAAALRVLYTVLVAPWPSPVPSDEIYYHGWANAIAAGRGFIDPFSLPGHPVATAAHPPLYPLLLAGVAKLGGTGQLAQRLAGVVFGCGTVVFCGLIGRRVAGERAGLVAAGLAAVSPILIGADGALLSETLFGLLVAAVVWAGLRVRDRPTLGRAAGLGVLIGLAALTRGEALLLAPLLGVPLLRRPAGGRAALALVAATLVVLAPWTVRNVSAFHHFVLVSTDTGNLVGGANCDATYHGAHLGGWWQPCIIDSPPALRRYLVANEAAANDRFLHHGLSYAGDHLGRLPVVLAVRELRTWGLFDPFELNESREKTVEDIGVVAYYPLAVLAALGVVVLRRRGRPTWELLVPVLLVAVTVALAYGHLRFREPADVAIVILAGVSIDAGLRRRAVAG